MNKNCDAKDNRWLHRFAVLTAAATFLLLGLGGLVTSNEAGMSVPDWPTSYGYNMFALPIKFWKGGAFFEHSHRLLASAVGFLTTILAVWIWLKDSRKWMKWLALAAFLGVVAQGVLGGLRVTMKMDSLGIFHGVIAQTFFVLTCAIALFTSGCWQKISEQKLNVPRGLQNLVLATTVLIFLQLILGATMRGQHAGLAIPDFPTAYGQIWPDTSADAVARYNAKSTNPNTITAFQINLQMIHRIVAIVILSSVAFCALWKKRLDKFEASKVASAWIQNLRLVIGVFLAVQLVVFVGAAIYFGELNNAALMFVGPVYLITCALFTVISFLSSEIALGWLGLILLQIGLGMATIWTNKAADVATAHVLVGALSLVTGALWCIIAFGRSAEMPETETAPFGAFGTFATNKQ
jgi:cytochrome c oxidase assembly protein subunit 15